MVELSRGKKLNTYWTRFRKLLNSKRQLSPRQIQASNRKTRTSKGKNKVKISAKSAVSRRLCRSWPQSIQSQERDHLFTLFFEYVRSLLVSANSIFFILYYSMSKLKALWFQTLYFLYFVLFYEYVRDSLVSTTNRSSLYTILWVSHRLFGFATILSFSQIIFNSWPGLKIGDILGRIAAVTFGREVHCSQGYHSN